VYLFELQTFIFPFSGIKQLENCKLK